MKRREKLELPFLFDLPQPPDIVQSAIDNWVKWLAVLPKAGPRVDALCGSMEKGYHHHVRHLQDQYHMPEENWRFGIDWNFGELMERHVHSLQPRRRDIVIGVHFKNTKIPTMLQELKINEEKFHRELRSAYDILAGKLCPL